MKNINEFLATINLCNDNELETLAAHCERLLNERKTTRDALRRELMENLQKALSDVLHNGFSLAIENIEKDLHDRYRCVIFDPDEIYSIEIE